jgi:ABC-type lipoprotein release transport system permease subunit
VIVAYGASRDLLEILNETAPGGALLLPLLGCLAAIVAIVVATTIWPAWRAAGRPAAETLRGAELRGHRPRRSRLPASPFGLGFRLAGARRVRTLSTALVVAAAASVVLLMLALASFLDGLQNDPGAIGKRYQLTANLPADSAPDVAAIDGVSAAAPRYQVDALDSFRLGETVRLVAYPGDHTDFEAPPLAEGRRVEGPGEAEVGQGLADALGLSPGSTLAVQLPSGREARFTVVGIVRAIEVEGRIAYVQPDRLLAADPDIATSIAVKLDDGADTAAVTQRLEDLGATPEDAAGTTDRSQKFLGVLAGVLRVVAGVNGLICLYILVQALAVTAVERRQALAVLRSGGAGRGTVTLVLLGAASAVLLIAVPVAIAVQRLLLGPLVSDLAAGYASPDLAAGPLQDVAVAAALLLLAAAAARWVARRDEGRPIAAALRAE